MSSKYDLCFVTVGDKAAARKLTAGLLDGRLAACVSAVPGVESSYRWKGRVEKSAEILLIIKTRRSLREPVARFVKRHHPYSVPEILFTGIAAGSRDYLAWLGANTAFPKNTPKNKAPEKDK